MPQLFHPRNLRLLSNAQLEQWRRDVRDGNRPALPISQSSALKFADAEIQRRLAEQRKQRRA